MGTVLNRKYSFLFWILSIHFVAAFFSQGFHHFDEHFQIVEFLNLKMGGTDVASLAPEFRFQMRPWFQPGALFLVTKFLSFFGISNPFFLTFLYRLLTALGWIWVLLFIHRKQNEWFRRSFFQKYTSWLVSITWFIPYMNVRASSDGWGTLLLIAGSFLLVDLFKSNVVLERDNRESHRMNGGIGKSLLIGILFGLSFLARYQTCVAVAAIYFWSLLFGKLGWRSLIVIAVAICATLLVGVGIDSWGYGEFAFAPWNYFYQNIVMKMAASISVRPWWEYLRLAFNRGIPPFSLALMVGVVSFWIRAWRHPFTWLTLPFFIVHLMIGHKELRFLYPVIWLSPLMLCKILDWWDKINHLKPWIIKILRVFLIINCLLLVGASTKSAQSGISLYKFLYASDIQKIYHRGDSPLTMVGLPLRFYMSHKIETEEVKSISDISSAEFYFLSKRGHEFFEFDQNSNCFSLYQAYPNWLLNFNVGGWIKRSRFWVLWRCRQN